jgi:hypothetical protein
MDWMQVASSLIAGVGGAGAVVLALGGWLGRRWEARLAERERAHHAAELERLKTILQQRADAEGDALTRRRDVYVEVARTMRVLLSSVSTATPTETAAFLSAYDAASVWAPDAVLDALHALFELVRVKNLATSSQAERQQAYARCILEMRRDAGYIETKFEYQFVTFA